MINYIWIGIMLLSVASSLWTQRLPEVALAVTDGIQSSFELLISLAAVVIFWTGLIKIAEQSGVIQLFGRIIYPVLRHLFPDVPKDHPAFGEMTMALSASAFGLSNAATPMGMRAMEQLETLQPDSEEASDAMCMFVTISASSIQLIPFTAIGYLSIYGCKNPSALLLPASIATVVSTLVGIASVWIAQRLSRRRTS